MSDDLTCPAGQRLRQIRHPARPYQGLQHIDGSPCLHKERSGKERRDDDGYRAAVIRGQRVGRRNGGDRRHTPTPDFISDGPGEIGTQFDPYDCVGKEPPEVSPPSERIAEIRRELHEPKTQEYSSWRVWKREYDAWLQSDYFLRAKDLLAALDASEARRIAAENRAAHTLRGVKFGSGEKAMTDETTRQEPKEIPIVSAAPSPERIAEIRDRQKGYEPHTTDGAWWHLAAIDLLAALDASEARRVVEAAGKVGVAGPGGARLIDALAAYDKATK